MNQQPASNPNNAAPAAGHGGHQQPGPHNKKMGKLKKIKDHKALKLVYIALLFSVTVLIVAIVASIFFFDRDSKSQAKLVDTSKYQAVFLNGGQVYFGKITNLTDSYISISDIYYLQVNQTVQPDANKNGANNNFTLAKLGCELHRPQDVMVINQSQVIFWENLKDDDSQNTVPGGIKKLAETDQGKNCQTRTDSSNTPANGTNNNAANSNSNSNSSNSSSTPAPEPAANQ